MDQQFHSLEKGIFKDSFILGVIHLAHWTKAIKGGEIGCGEKISI
jgi:hypothetical protein